MLLAIDPGTAQSGWCLMDGYRPVAFGKTDNGELLQTIINGDLVCSRAAIEKVASYGMAVGREVFDTCVWIGRFEQAIRDYQTEDVEYVYRAEEKQRLCRDSRAKDTNIRRALIDRFAKHDLKNGKGTKQKPDWFYGFRADCWAAYAVGVVALDRREEKGCQV